MFHTDDAMFASKSVARIPPQYQLEVLGLWLKCGQWAAHEATDGYVPIAKVHELSPLPTRATNNRIALMVDVLGKVSRVTWHGQPALLFADWDVWQDTAEQVKARKDGWRERKRRQRAAAKAEQVSPIEATELDPTKRQSKTPQSDKVTSTSKRPDLGNRQNVPRDIERDTPPYVTPPLIPSPTVETYVPNAAVANAPARNGRSAGYELAGKIVDKYLAREPNAVKSSMRHQVSALLVEGHEPADVEAAVELYTGRPGASPNLLPHLLSDVIRMRNPQHGRGLPPGFGTVSAKAQGQLDAAESLIAKRRAAGESPQPRELEP